MKKILIFVSIFFCVLIGKANSTSSAQEDLQTETTITATLEIPEYEDWEVATIQGKLKMNGLPISPSLRIFMIKDSLVNISIRAPFFGEVGVMEITTDSVSAVNKMNKTYVKEDVSGFLKYYPGGLSDFQDMLLARVFLPGHDIMEEDIEELVDVYYDEPRFNLVPKPAAAIEGVQYGFVVDETFRPLALVVLPEERENMEIDLQYQYNSKGYDLLFSYRDGAKVMSTTLELKDPEWKGEAPKRVELEKKYRKLPVHDFLLNIGK